MKLRDDTELAAMWSRHSAEWRDSAQICSQWREAALVDARLLESSHSKNWWRLLRELGITLLITREYEHLVMALTAAGSRPRTSYLPLPHPSGLAVDRSAQRVLLASTRNPNQVYTLKPVNSVLSRADMPGPSVDGGFLTPVSSAFYPGSLYLHDLAVIGTSLFGNAVGQNAVARLEPDGQFELAWWPRAVEREGKPVTDRNYIQLNSIAAGKSLATSYFSASSAKMGRLRPGHLNYPVDRRGVIFSGRTREPICTGLTRPHSARLRDGKVWVANSGYGELGFVNGGRLEVVARLPGWTRGLCIVKDIAFVATSRVIPRYAGYAPGLDMEKSRCGVHAVCCKTGKLLASLEWPRGNQVFAIDWIDSAVSTGFPFVAETRKQAKLPAFFYTYMTC
jgi:uncharacterized protein (TIGR03032 family)